MPWRSVARLIIIAIWVCVFAWFGYDFVHKALADSQSQGGAFTVTRILTSVGLTALICWGLCKITLKIVAPPPR